MMSDPSSDESSGKLWTCRVPVVFEVAARSRADAHWMVDDALTGPGRATAPFQDRVILHADGDVEGVLGWAHQADPVPGAEMPRWRQRSVLADLTIVEVLRVIVREELGRPESERALTEPELTQVQLTVAAADRFVTIPDPADPDRDPLFEGHAGEASEILPDGVYEARDIAGQDLRVVVGASRFAGGGRAAASLPAATVDSRTLDEIAGRLSEYTRATPVVEVLEEVSRLVTAAGRDGVNMTELTGARAAGRPSLVSVGVVTWSDEPEVEPTIMIGPRILELTRNAATMVFEEMRDSDAFDGATDFLRSHSEPAQWEHARDVDDWLQALAEVSPYPRVTLTQLPIDGGTDEHNDLLADALTRRATQLQPEDPPVPGPAQPQLRRAL
jgi:hypothetical protein